MGSGGFGHLVHGISERGSGVQATRHVHEERMDNQARPQAMNLAGVSFGFRFPLSHSGGKSFGAVNQGFAHARAQQATRNQPEVLGSSACH